MAPRQNTFTLVPNPLGLQGLISRPANGPQSKPPMTSKQAQKLYRQANRQPRMSKAEQRRIDREEQERIRRELDKEKQANKTRILRDKKKAKEQQVLEEKKRKGLPLVDVRPSQDTISRFVRGNGLGKKRDSTGASVHLPPIAEEQPRDDFTPSPTRHGHGHGHGQKEQEQEPDEENNGLPTEHAPHLAQHKRQRPSGQQASQEVNNSPARGGYSAIPGGSSNHVAGATAEEPREHMPAAEHITEEESSGVLPRERPTKPPSSARSTTKAPKIAGDSTLIKGVSAKRPSTPLGGETTGARSVGGCEDSGSGSAQRLVLTGPGRRALTRPQAPTRPKQAPMPPPRHHPPLKAPPPQHLSTVRKPLQEGNHASNRSWRAADNASKLSSLCGPALGPVPARACRASPAIPAFKQARPRASASEVQKPKFLRPDLGKPAAARTIAPGPANAGHPQNLQDDFRSVLPTSTQLFVMSHMDDIFPSPSQEAQELQSEQPIAKPARAASMRSPQSRQLIPHVAYAGPVMSPPPRPTVEAVEPAMLMPFISTQDLVLSSQDLRDLEDTAATQGNGARDNGRNNIAPSSHHDTPVLPQPSSRVSPQPTPQQETPRRSHRLPRKRNRAYGVVTMRELQGLKGEIPATDHSSALRTSWPIPAPYLGPDKAAQKADAPVETLSPVSPEKPRFFGPSGCGLDVLLAMDESRKTHAEEERRRQAQPPNPKSLGGDATEMPQHNAAADGPPAASQETDYGDLELDAVDLLDL